MQDDGLLWVTVVLPATVHVVLVIESAITGIERTRIATERASFRMDTSPYCQTTSLQSQWLNSGEDARPYSHGHPPEVLVLPQLRVGHRASSGYRGLATFASVGTGAPVTALAEKDMTEIFRHAFSNLPAVSSVEVQRRHEDYTINVTVIDFDRSVRN